MVIKLLTTYASHGMILQAGCNRHHQDDMLTFLGDRGSGMSLSLHLPRGIHILGPGG